ncbi:MAG: hypothetical protein Q8R67_00745 [Rhodoferax sp.]|nr:hypothetical protein [Rhodoferax sp.]MDP3650183.1 hypothetical protein [Rhodoferax sp.]
MSTASPTSHEEAQRALWPLSLFIFVPLVLYAFFEWRVYYPSSAQIHALLAALFLAPIASILLLWRRARLVSLEIIPATPIYKVLNPGQQLGAIVGLFGLLYLWVLIAFSLSLLLPQFERTEYAYQIAEAKECTWKCALGCRYKVRFVDWPGPNASWLCADGINPRISVGDTLLVRGYISSHAIYVDELAR